MDELSDLSYFIEFNELNLLGGSDESKHLCNLNELKEFNELSELNSYDELNEFWVQTMNLLNWWIGWFV